MSKVMLSRPSSTATKYRVGQTFSSTASPPVRVTNIKGARQRQDKDKNIEAAVFSYVQAVRTLGKTQVNTSEIAKALGLSVSKVDEVVPRLMEKGIRRAG